ncbi:hypothetical protein SISNIDRAFT_490563 [Sistotremastrum niveocremeum HHB9708]|uniref:Uncharacterized protein n=1 Tax=Sistotremastrum niveocremeum HHB9708 TaxID=1314777 RepID=A0A164NUA0_9AGAM|nr:hypothetical protein SISNIDRAFT_490563 [Sistotremastrum niveocremeum HHB9708]
MSSTSTKEPFDIWIESLDGKRRYELTGRFWSLVSGQCYLAFNVENLDTEDVQIVVEPTFDQYHHKSFVVVEVNEKLIKGTKFRGRKEIPIKRISAYFRSSKSKSKSQPKIKTDHQNWTRIFVKLRYVLYHPDPFADSDVCHDSNDSNDPKCNSEPKPRAATVTATEPSSEKRPPPPPGIPREHDFYILIFAFPGKQPSELAPSQDAAFLRAKEISKISYLEDCPSPILPPRRVKKKTHKA